MRSGGRVVEGARLESEYTSKAYRGFESLPLRHGTRLHPAQNHHSCKSAGLAVPQIVPQTVWTAIYEGNLSSGG